MIANYTDPAPMQRRKGGAKAERAGTGKTQRAQHAK